MSISIEKEQTENNLRMKRKQNKKIEPDKIAPGCYDKVYLMYFISIIW